MRVSRHCYTFGNSVDRARGSTSQPVNVDGWDLGTRRQGVGESVSWSTATRRVGVYRDTQSWVAGQRDTGSAQVPFDRHRWITGTLKEKRGDDGRADGVWGRLAMWGCELLGGSAGIVTLFGQVSEGHE